MLAIPAGTNVANCGLAQAVFVCEISEFGACPPLRYQSDCLGIGNLGGGGTVAPFAVEADHVGLVLLVGANLKVAQGEVRSICVNMVDLGAWRRPAHERVYKKFVDWPTPHAPVSIQSDSRVTVANEVLENLAGRRRQAAVIAAVVNPARDSAVNGDFVVWERLNLNCVH